MIHRCPHCKNTFDDKAPRRAVRVCCQCERPIGRHHKWFINQEGRMEHRHCDHPEHYLAEVKPEINQNKEPPKLF